MNFDRYRRRVTVRGSNAKEIILNERIQSFNDYLNKSISGQDVVIDGKTYLVGIQDVKFHDERSREAKYIFTNLDTPVRVGSLVEWDNSNWIVTLEESETIQSHLTYYMTRCNEVLTWQDGFGVVYNAPCILADKTSVYSDGLSKTELISLGTDQMSITIPSNEQTEVIPLNKRFIFKSDGNNIYEVSRKDNILHDGLIVFVAKKSLYNPNTDNLELNIANYNGKLEPDPEIPVDPETPDEESIMISGLERFTIWDENEEYTADTDREVEWSLDREDLIHIVRTDGNKCYISSSNTSKIGDSTLNVKTIDGEPELFAGRLIPKFYQ